MGVEGKDRAKVLEAGAAALSNQLGLAVLRLRKSFGLSLAELSTQSGVAKSIISQIERNETNPTLTTIWRLAHALDASIESILQGADDGPFIEHLKRGTTPIFVSDDGLCRLAVTGWLKTVDWLQWYDFQADPGGVLESTAHARGSIECLSVLEGELEVDVGGSKEVAAEGETLRYRCDTAHRIRNLGAEAGPRDDGLHPEGGGDGLSAATIVSAPASRASFTSWAKSRSKSPPAACFSQSGLGAPSVADSTLFRPQLRRPGSGHGRRAKTIACQP